jgi:hypothetical protein
MGKHDVVDWLIAEATSVLSQLDSAGVLALSTPGSHVDVAEAFDESTYPFVGVRHLAGTPRSGGLGAGNARVTNENYNGDLIDSVDYTTVVDGRFEIAPVTDNDPAKRHRISDALAAHFDVLVRNNDFGPTVEDVSVEDESQADRTSEYVRSGAIELSVTYTRSNSQSVTAAESVAVDVDAGKDSDTSDPDEFDYTYNG